MATARVIYFSGTDELTAPTGMVNVDFAAKFPGVRGKRYDGFHMWVGRDSAGMIRPVTRMIDFKAGAKLHKCDARCQNATGRVCECSCRGKMHGAGGFACEAVAA